MDNPTGDPKILFDVIVALTNATRDFDNVDHTGENVPTAQQVADAAAVLAKARELHRLLSS